MLIDGTYFIGPIAIEGMNFPTGASSITNDANKFYFESFMQKYEKEYLLRILGRNMYLDFIAYLSDPKEQISKWYDLKNLLSKKGNSAVANYVFFKYVKRSGISVQDSGVVEAMSEKTADINKVIIPAWNDMVEMNHEIYDFLKDKQEYDGFCFDESMLKKINWFGV